MCCFLECRNRLTHHHVHQNLHVIIVYLISLLALPSLAKCGWFCKLIGLFVHVYYDIMGTESARPKWPKMHRLQRWSESSSMLDQRALSSEMIPVSWQLARKWHSHKLGGIQCHYSLPGPRLPSQAKGHRSLLLLCNQTILFGDRGTQV